MNCKNTGQIGKDLKRKVNPDDSTDPDDMKRTNGSFYMSGFCYKRLYEKRKAAAKRLQSTRQTRSQAEPRLAPVASRRARPTEVDALVGDYSKAKEVLGWEPKTKVEELCRIMVESDLALAKHEKAVAGL